MNEAEKYAIEAKVFVMAIHLLLEVYNDPDCPCEDIRDDIYECLRDYAAFNNFKLIPLYDGDVTGIMINNKIVVGFKK